MRRAVTVLLCAALAAPACARDARDGERLTVVTSVYPMTWVARRIGGEHVTVVDLAPPGAEPHDLELTPSQVAQVERADVVLLVRGLQPALDDAAPAERTVDALARAGGDDPHLWLDPVALQAVVTGLTGQLVHLDGDHAQAYKERAGVLLGELSALDRELSTALAGCRRRDLVTSHAAFGRFATKYGLRETGIAGVDAEAEPSPGRIAEVVAFVKRNGVTTVFAESAGSRPARTIARETGARVAVLDPLEVFTGDDYLAVMRRNLGAVREGLGCP